MHKRYERNTDKYYSIDYNKNYFVELPNFDKEILSKFGYRLQYSVFKIENSERILNIVSSEIENRFAKKFTQSDSVYIFRMSSSCKVTKYGYSKNEDSYIIFIE